MEQLRHRPRSYSTCTETLQRTGKSSHEVAPTTSATFLPTENSRRRCSLLITVALLLDELAVDEEEIVTEELIRSATAQD